MKALSFIRSMLMIGTLLWMNSCTEDYDLRRGRPGSSGIEIPPDYIVVPDDVCGETTYALCNGKRQKGTISVANNLEYLYITFKSPESMRDLFVWVGANYQDGSAQHPAAFPYVKNGCNCSEYIFKIPLADLERDPNNCFDVFAITDLNKGGSLNGTTSCQSGKGKNKHSMHLDYCPAFCLGG